MSTIALFVSIYTEVDEGLDKYDLRGGFGP